MLQKTIKSEVHIIIDAEVYDRSNFNKYLHLLNELISKSGGEFLFEGIAPQIIEGDWKPRNTILAFRFTNEDLFRKLWISGEHRNLRNEFRDTADLKVVMVENAKRA